MITNHMIMLGIGLVVSIVANLLNYYLAHNPKLAANEVCQFIARMLKGLSQAAEIQPSGIAEHIVSGVAGVAEKAAEEALRAQQK